MYSRYHAIITCFLFCLLFASVIGCEQISGIINLKEDKHDTGKQLLQLLRQRLELQEKIFEAMDSYRKTTQKLREQRTQFQQYLGRKSELDAIELFSKSKLSDIPPDLRAAYSCWQTLLPDKMQQLQIDRWLEKRLTSGILEELDIRIKEIENLRQLGRFLDQDELTEIDKLLATAKQVVEEKYTDAADRAMLSEEAINELKKEVAN